MVEHTNLDGHTAADFDRARANDFLGSVAARISCRRVAARMAGMEP